MELMQKVTFTILYWNLLTVYISGCMKNWDVIWHLSKEQHKSKILLPWGWNPGGTPIYGLYGDMPLNRV